MSQFPQFDQRTGEKLNMGHLPAHGPYDDYNYDPLDPPQQDKPAYDPHLTRMAGGPRPSLVPGCPDPCGDAPQPQQPVQSALSELGQVIARQHELLNALDQAACDVLAPAQEESCRASEDKDDRLSRCSPVMGHILAVHNSATQCNQRLSALIERLEV